MESQSYLAFLEEQFAGDAHSSQTLSNPAPYQRSVDMPRGERDWAELSRVIQPRSRVSILGVSRLDIQHSVYMLSGEVGYRFAGAKIKRILDLIAAVGLLILLAPVMLGIAIVVRLESPGPILFRQERVGIDRKIFHLIKFRTMKVDAENHLPDLLATIADGSGTTGLLFKLKADPRVTRTGAFLRRYSLDELPQLWNVLRGEMSLVGPRPPLLREVDVYTGEELRRLLVKPGMTGLWQISGRSNLSWGESMRLDLHYVENWSIMLDLVILWRTVRVVLSPIVYV